MPMIPVTLLHPELPSLARYSSLYRATVIGNTDPMGSGRVQIWVESANLTGLWANTCLPPGAAATYKVGDDCWVMFEGGDPQLPVVMGKRG